MKKNLHISFISFLFIISLSFKIKAQGVPEILYYKFNNSGTSINNLASSPPSGTSTADIYGSITQGSTGPCSGKALVGSGNLSSTDYVDTKWRDSLTGSWTISFWSKNLDSTTALYYLFSDLSAGAFRCFTGGVAGAGNILLRGPFTDVLLTGGGGKLPKVSTFVYDSSAGYIYAYLNGSLVNSVAQSAISIYSTATLILSGYNSLTGLNAGALMDEFRFYDRALSSSEVQRFKYISTSSTITQSAKCSYTGPSGKYSWRRSGTYKDTIPNYNSCDSIITINLTITGNSSSTITVDACSSYVSPSKKFTWTVSGTYQDILVNKQGCDSIMTIKLNINRSFSAFSVNACNSYKSPSGKYTWSTSGFYIDTIKNKRGCDSIMDITLIIRTKSSYAFNVKRCDSYKSPSGRYTWTKSGNYADTIANSYGCDSLLSIKVTIVYRTADSMMVTRCEKFKSPSGKYTWAKSGIYMDTIRNNASCDSVITIDLTIHYNSSTLITAESCEKYTSPSGKYTWILSGAYNDTIPNRSGCDSFMTIDLKILKPTFSSFFKTECVRYLSPSAKHTWIKSGKYIDTIPNKKGCDSIITINLTVNEVNIGVTQNDPLLTADAFQAVYQWLDCKKNYSPIAGETKQSFTAKVVGDYAVRVTENLCSDTSLCYTVLKVGGIGWQSLDNTIVVYPNPAERMVNISAARPLSNATLRLVSITGEKMMVMENLFGDAFSFDISENARGIYFIEITENEKIARIKLVRF